MHRVSLQGKGNVIRRGFADIEADAYLLVAGDDTYDAGAAPQLLRRLIEVLAPLMAWIACQYVVPAGRARPVAAGLVAFCALVSLGGWNGGGHEPWARKGFVVRAPPMAQAGRSAVLLAGDEPQSWRIPFLPAAASYLLVASNFPESPVYAERVATLLEEHPERHAMLPAVVDREALRVEGMNAGAARFGAGRPGRLPGTALAGRARLDDAGPGACRLVPRPGTTRDVVAEDRAIQAAAGQKLERYDWRWTRCPAGGCPHGSGRPTIPTPRGFTSGAGSGTSLNRHKLSVAI